jgi:phage protein D
MAKPNRDEPLLPNFGVKLNGQALNYEVTAWIVNVVCEDDLDLPGMFTLELISHEDEDGITSWTDDQRFELGAAIEVSLGYGEDLEALISGEITALEPTFSIAGAPTLIVRGFDKRHRLNAARRTRSFLEQKDSDIASQLGSDAGLAVDATDSGVTHPYLLQANQTDFEFLLERARRIQYELVMAGDTLLFRPSGHAQSEALTLTLEDDLLEFRPRLTLVPLTELKLLGWDLKAKQPITASAKAGDEVTTMGGAKSAAQRAGDVLSQAVETLVRMPVASQAEADQIAAGRFNAATLDCIRGDARCRGRTDVRAGTVIRLDDLGTRFSGQYYVTSAVHRYTRREGYLTEFQVRRTAA